MPSTGVLAAGQPYTPRGRRAWPRRHSCAPGPGSPGCWGGAGSAAWAQAGAWPTLVPSSRCSGPAPARGPGPGGLLQGPAHRRTPTSPVSQEHPGEARVSLVPPLRAGGAPLLLTPVAGLGPSSPRGPRCRKAEAERTWPFIVGSAKHGALLLLCALAPGASAHGSRGAAGLGRGPRSRRAPGGCQGRGLGSRPSWMVGSERHWLSPSSAGWPAGAGEGRPCPRCSRPVPGALR